MHRITLTVIVIATFNFSMTYADEEECKLISPDGFWQNYVSPFFLRRVYCKTLLENEPDNGQYKQCRNGIRKYFELNHEEDENVVKEYAMKCKKLMGKDWSRCANIILHFNSLHLCWNMKTAPMLFNVLSRDSFLSDENLKEINLSRTLYKSFEKSEINLAKCSHDFHSYFANTIDVLNYFLSLKKEFIDKGNKYETVCDCEQISGIYKIFSKRKLYERSQKLKRSPRIDVDGQGKESYSALSFSTVNKPPAGNQNEFIFKYFGEEDKKELSDLYQIICLHNPNTSVKEYWTKNRLDVLAGKVECMDSPTVKDILIDGFEIAKAGWYDLNKPESQWPIDYLLSKIVRNDDKFNEHSVQLIAQVISLGFSPKTYQDFIESIGQTYNFNNVNCAQNILKAAMFETDSEGNQSKKTYWHLKEDKQTFMDHLKLLLDLYTRTRRLYTYAYNCREFSDSIKSIEVVFFKTKWTEQHLNNLIKVATENAVKIDEFIKCSEFSLKISENTITCTSKEKDDGKKYWIPTENEQEDFRMKLFSDLNKVYDICLNVGSKYEIVDYEGIMRVYKRVLDQ